MCWMEWSGWCCAVSPCVLFFYSEGFQKVKPTWGSDIFCLIPFNIVDSLPRACSHTQKFAKTGLITALESFLPFCTVTFSAQLINQCTSFAIISSVYSPSLFSRARIFKIPVLLVSEIFYLSLWPRVFKVMIAYSDTSCLMPPSWRAIWTHPINQSSWRHLATFFSLYVFLLWLGPCLAPCLVS